MSTDFLFAQPGYGSGAARVLDLFGMFDAYNESPTPRIADARAIYADWRMIARDIESTARTVIEAGEYDLARARQLPLL